MRNCPTCTPCPPISPITLPTFLEAGIPLEQPQRKTICVHFSTALKATSGRGSPQRTRSPESTVLRSPPSYPVTVLSLDIETYGAVAGCVNQTNFHPQKSIVLDGCPEADLIQTVALTWRDPFGECQSGFFRWKDRGTQARLARWLRHLTTSISALPPKTAPRYPPGLWGMNIKFDVLFLRRCSTLLRCHLRPPFPLLDMSVVNYLNSEIRPERSLKNIAPLLRVARYEEGRTCQKGHKFRSSLDPELRKYNCLDTYASLACIEKLVDPDPGPILPILAS